MSDKGYDQWYDNESHNNYNQVVFVARKCPCFYERLIYRVKVTTESGGSHNSYNDSDLYCSHSNTDVKRFVFCYKMFVTTNNIFQYR